MARLKRHEGRKRPPLPDEHAAGQGATRTGRGYLLKFHQEQSLTILKLTQVRGAAEDPATNEEGRRTLKNMHFEGCQTGQSVNSSLGTIQITVYSEQRLWMT